MKTYAHTNTSFPVQERKLHSNTHSLQFFYHYLGCAFSTFLPYTYDVPLLPMLCRAWFIVVHMQCEGAAQRKQKKRKSEHKTNGWYGCKIVTDKRLSGRYSSVVQCSVSCRFRLSGAFHFSLLLLFSWPYTQRPFPFENTKQVIDNGCHCDPMRSCCKAGVILITYASRNATRHGGPKAAGMRCEPSCIMANAPLWSDLWNARTWRPWQLYSVWFRHHVPWTPLGVSILDLDLLYSEIWALFWCDAIPRIFHRVCCVGGVLLNTGKSGLIFKNDSH